jgi:transcriptional regulator with XRE-family HTH domain
VEEDIIPGLTKKHHTSLPVQRGFSLLPVTGKRLIFVDMNTTAMPERKVHEGRNVKRIREMLGIKQEALAIDLDMSQQNVSRIEEREALEPELLERIAGILKVPADAIKHFSEEAAINVISNTFQDFRDNAIANANHCTFNPLDKMVELYERMLQLEREKTELMERLVKEMKKD